MKTKMLSLLLLISLSGFSLSQSAREMNNEMESDEAEIRTLIDQFLITRLQRDEQALRSILTDDVDQLPTSGLLRSGIDAVAEGALATSDRTGGDRSITIESIRFLSPDVAIVDGPYDIVNRLDGADRHYLTSITVLKAAGNWKITAIRNMQPTQ